MVLLILQTRTSAWIPMHVWMEEPVSTSMEVISVNVPQDLLESTVQWVGFTYWNILCSVVIFIRNVILKFKKAQIIVLIVISFLISKYLRYSQYM